VMLLTPKTLMLLASEATAESSTSAAEHRPAEEHVAP
jgi:hypothetical protein